MTQNAEDALTRLVDGRVDKDRNDIRLAGVPEARELLGIDYKVQFSNLSRRVGFPAPCARLASGRVWLVEDLEEYKTRMFSDRHDARSAAI
jgi:hypothetical protein